MPYQVKPTAKFKSSLQELIKKHYRKKPADEAKFRKLVGNFLKALADTPICADVEGFPDKAYIEGCELRKKRWGSAPGLRGSVGKVRLVFLINHPQETVYPLWIYTHAEHSGRLPKKALRKVIQATGEP